MRRVFGIKPQIVQADPVVCAARFAHGIPRDRSVGVQQFAIVKHRPLQGMAPIDNDRVTADLQADRGVAGHAAKPGFQSERCATAKQIAAFVLFLLIALDRILEIVREIVEQRLAAPHEIGIGGEFPVFTLARDMAGQTEPRIRCAVGRIQRAIAIDQAACDRARRLVSRK